MKKLLGKIKANGIIVEITGVSLFLGLLLVIIIPELPKATKEQVMEKQIQQEEKYMDENEVKLWR